ncbi:MAG TPA: hypothetical protein VKA34_06800 [Balneolales bacterium]|nr:hypothetical protein [Balneolales bacterium]
MIFPNRSFVQSLHFRDSKILESRKHSGCCGFEVAQALILNKSPGFAKPSYILETFYLIGN